MCQRPTPTQERPTRQTTPSPFSAGDRHFSLHKQSNDDELHPPGALDRRGRGRRWCSQTDPIDELCDECRVNRCGVAKDSEGVHGGSITRNPGKGAQGMGQRETRAQVPQPCHWKSRGKPSHVNGGVALGTALDTEDRGGPMPAHMPLTQPVKESLVPR